VVKKKRMRGTMVKSGKGNGSEGVKGRLWEMGIMEYESEQVWKSGRILMRKNKYRKGGHEWDWEWRGNKLQRRR